MAILRHEGLDVHSMLSAHDCFLIVLAAAVCALVLSLFNGNLDFLWQVQVDESIHTSSVLFEHFCFCDSAGEVGKDESIPACVGDSQHLESQSICDLSVDVSSVKQFLGLQEEWVAHVFLFTSECLYVCEDLCHGNNWNTQINTESLLDLSLEGVGSSAEDDLWALRPPSKELLILLFEDGFQHFFIYLLINYACFFP